MLTSNKLEQVLQSYNISEEEYEKIMNAISEKKIDKVDDKVLTCAAIGIAAGIAVVHGILSENLLKLSKEELTAAGYVSILASIIFDRDENTPEKVVENIKDWLKYHFKIAKDFGTSETTDICILVDLVSKFVGLVVSKFEEKPEKGGENDE